MMSAPSSASRTASARPWPRAAPVTSATLPSTKPMAFSFAVNGRIPRCRSDAQPGEQALVVGRRAAEQQLGRLGPAEVQGGRMLPGEADAAVHLDVLVRGE